MRRKEQRRVVNSTDPELPERLAGRVAAYTLAAAAGLGILIDPKPADARIIYTSAHILFQEGASLDINNDGITDFIITQVPCVCSYGHSLRIGGVPGNGVRGYFSTFFSRLDALRLRRGTKIGGGETFYRNRQVLIAESFFISGSKTYYFGQWGQNRSGFVGPEFLISGQAHYAWAEIQLNATHPYRGVVTGYAYNTVPGQLILAGELIDSDQVIDKKPAAPATLGVLALGAPGLDMWRERKRLPVPTQADHDSFD